MQIWKLRRLQNWSPRVSLGRGPEDGGSRDERGIHGISGVEGNK